MSFQSRSSIPAAAGVGLKPQHFEQILAQPPSNQNSVCWFEIHAENYMGAGGQMHHFLQQIRERYPLSLHGVGLSLGSLNLPCNQHLKALNELIQRYEPGLVSEHLSWSKHHDVVLNDLLPVPYTQESLAAFCNNIDKTQTALKRQILIENPSSYFMLKEGDFSEVDFLVTLAQRSGCKILLDVNNVYVSACNHGFNAQQYIHSIPKELVGEIHLAGHSVQRLLSGEVLIDDHGSQVCSRVWKLYESTLAHIGAKPTLIEWDSDVPAWNILSQQASLAQNRLEVLVEHDHG